jgi:dihydrofolate synthase/folylpolyglutamate synthase
MTSVNEFAQAQAILATLVPLSKEITGKDITLERMRVLMAALGNPEQKLKIIHVAGTSGKTSTSYYIASLLKSAGKTVGLTVSPHVDSITERIQINLEPISKSEFASCVTELMDLINKASIRPTYFEFLVAMAYWYFAKIGVDYAVIETGLGGLHDATNVAGHSDKVCVITDIGLDHMHILGHTLSEIARQKAGIIYPQNQVFMYQQSDEVNEICIEHVTKNQAQLTVLNQDILEVEAPSWPRALPAYQQRNWLLAYQVFDFVKSTDALPPLTTKQLEDTMHIQVPARMDTKIVGAKTIIMDGAHNEQKMAAFVESFTRLYPKQKSPVLMSLKRGKEFAAVLPLLKPITSILFLTEYSVSQDLVFNPIDAEELGRIAKKFGFDQLVVEPQPTKAYQLLLSEAGDKAIITGSFYLISQLRQLYPELR